MLVSVVVVVELGTRPRAITLTRRWTERGEADVETDPQRLSALAVEAVRARACPPLLTVLASVVVVVEIGRRPRAITLPKMSWSRSWLDLARVRLSGLPISSIQLSRTLKPPFRTQATQRRFAEYANAPRGGAAGSSIIRRAQATTAWSI